MAKKKNQEPEKTSGEAHADLPQAKHGESDTAGDQAETQTGRMTTSSDMGGSADNRQPAKRTGKRSEGSEEESFQSTANDMKAALAKQPKVRIYVPLLPGEPKGTQLPVEINGYKMFVPKGVPGVEVPQAVAEIVHESLGIYEEASSNVRSQNNPDRPLRTDLQSEADRSRLNA